MDSSLIESVLIFQKFSKYTEKEIHQMIRDESPQTIAVILAKLGTVQAKKILEYFPKEDQTNIVLRMASLKEVASEAVYQVALALKDKMEAFETYRGQEIGGSKKMAEILNLVQQKTGKDLLSEIAKKDSGLAQSIKKDMFSFSDILNSEDEGLRRALADIQPRILALALKGAEKDLIEKIFRNLTTNRLKLLRDEISYLGPRRVSEIETAKNEVIEIMREYQNRGILIIKGRDSQDKWV